MVLALILSFKKIEAKIVVKTGFVAAIKEVLIVDVCLSAAKKKRWYPTIPRRDSKNTTGISFLGIERVLFCKIKTMKRMRPAIPNLKKVKDGIGNSAMENLPAIKAPAKNSVAIIIMLL